MAISSGTRALLAASIVLACASPALSRDDDVEFAIALADRGYEDLAQKEVDRMLKGAATAEARENATYTRCQLLRRAALLAANDEKAEPKDVREKFSAAIREFEAFLKSYPASRLSSDAEFNVGNLMKDFAYYLSKNKEKFPAAEQEAVAKEAGKIFEDAISYLRKIKDREEEKDRALPEDDEGKYWDRNVAWFYLCQAMMDRALVLPPGDALRIQQLTQASEETQLLLEQTEGTVIGYFAGRILGNIHWNRAQMAQGFAAEDVQEAITWFDMPLGAADLPDLDQWPPVRNCMFETAFEFGGMCNRIGTLEGQNYQKVLVDRIAQIEAKQPSIRKERFGLQALIEKARAMAALGMHEAAVKLLSDISNEAKDTPGWGPAVDQLAKQGLNEALASIPPDSPLKVGPDVLFKAAEGSRRQGEHGRAIRTYQRTIVSCENEADPERRKTLLEQYWATCWARINECYAGMSRHLEAFYAADVPVQKYLADRRTDHDETVGDLVKFRIYALQAVVNATPKERQAEYAGRLKAAKDLVAEKFPWIGSETVAAVAVDKLRKANGLAAAGEKEKAAATYLEAIADFRKIPEKEVYFPMAQARVGECLVSMGKAQEGLQHLDAFLEKRKADDSRDAPPLARQAYGYAVLWRASALDDLKTFDKVVETLADFESRFQGAKLEPYLPRVRYLRIRALVELKRGPEAVAEAETLRKEFPDNPNTSQGALAAANDLRFRSLKAEAAGDRAGALDLKKKALDHYDFWLKRTASPTAENYKFVGTMHDEVGNGDRAAECWTKALEMFEAAGNADEAELLTVYLAGLLVDQKRYPEALPKFEFLFIKTPDDNMPLRALYESLRRRPSNVAAPDWEKKLRGILDGVEKAIAKDPDVAALAADVKRSAADLNFEILVRAFSDKPEQRRALASASVFTILGFDAAMPQEVRTAVFNLANRRPELMYKMARCYEEMAGTDPGNSIRAINLYMTLVDAAQDDFNEPKRAGSRYSERWFEWKYRWAKVALATGTQYKSDAFLRVACDIVKAMGVVGELEKAEKLRAGYQKEFESLRDQADTALRGLGKEGCK